MICFSSKLPVLQVGSHQLKNYETEWIFLAIEMALENSDTGNAFVAEHIYGGLLHYLQNECPWTLLKIENLYDKMEALLGKIGFSHLESLPRLCPAIRISVLKQLEQLDCPIEMVLLQTIQDELGKLAQYGAQEVILDDTVEAINILIPGKKWTKHCQLLHDELVNLQESYNVKQRDYLLKLFDERSSQ